VSTILASSSDRPAWLAARQGGVTATDVARLARGGAGTWAAVRAEKAGTARDFHNAAMQHGNNREPVILEYAAAAFGLEPCGDLHAADDEPRFLATPDALNDAEIGEVKTTVHDWEILSDAPGRYIDQMLWQMRVTGRRRGRLIFEPHEDGVPTYPWPKHFVVEYDEDRVTVLEQAASEFLASDAEPDEDAAVLDALVDDAMNLKEIADAAAARHRAALDRIEAHLGGEPRKFEGSRANLTRSADSVSRRFDSSAFKKAAPDTFQQFQVDVPVKGRLTITPRSDAA
jgi:hypothetical protein